MRLLLTGGKGMLATPLAQRLSVRHEVSALDIDDVDITDADALARAFDTHGFEAALHLAAWTDVDGCERDPARADLVNHIGTRNVAQACADAGASMLYISTDYVFDGTKDEPYVESDPVAPLSAYGRSKLAGEEAVRELVPRWWIVRCQSIYGLQRKSFVDAILARARAGQPLSVVTDQTVSPSYAEDLADALTAAFQRCRPGLYHASNAGGCTWFECARTALDLTGLEHVEIAPTTAASFGRPAPRPAYSVFSCEKLLLEAGHRLRPWQEAVADYLGTRQKQQERDA